MNVLILELPPNSNEGTVEVSRQRLDEIILRKEMQVGHKIRIGVLNGSLGTGQIVGIGHDSVTLAYHCTTASPAPSRTDIIVAIPRPQIVRRLLRDAAMLGVHKLVLVRSALTDKNYLQSHALTKQAVNEQLRIGLEQAGTTIAPEVVVNNSWRQFVEAWSDTYDQKFLTCPSGISWASASQNKLANESKVVAAIGPELGWTAEERRWFVEQGFDMVNLSPRILRVDVAVTFVAGLIESRRCDSVEQSGVKGL